MSIYLFCFIGTITLLIASRKVKKSQRWVLEAAALLLPCLLAAFRANTIGTDIKVYLEPMTQAAIYSENFKHYLTRKWILGWRYVTPARYEPAFTVLVYIVAKVFRNLFAVQFFVQAFTIVPVYCAVKKVYREDDKYVWLGVLVYLFMFYNRSLNAMRQSIAMGFLLLSYAYMVEHNRKKCFMTILVAVLFHKTAIIGIAIYFMYSYVNKGRTKDFKIFHRRFSGYYFNMYLVILFGLCILASISTISVILKLMGQAKYIAYLKGSLQFMPNQIILRLPLFFLLIHAWRRGNGKEDFRFLFAALCLDLILSQLTSMNSFAGRIGYYFSQLNIITFPTIYRATRRNKLVLLAMAGYLLCFWLFYFVINGAAETVPYVFGI